MDKNSKLYKLIVRTLTFAALYQLESEEIRVQSKTVMKCVTV